MDILSIMNIDSAIPHILEGEKEGLLQISTKKLLVSLKDINKSRNAQQAQFRDHIRFLKSHLYLI